ncbi:hypothetical protein [Halobacillus sp. A5]|uniref:hypothetical protein n=1 Tax=Halobacillus sp. A5 TaxID=2880263 RepID=UPI0020A6617F|nr:hypothetical protein [Halobacillus sp. A5]MCP3026493.1 hypothetical protein [Halobacillus sp. A5]
MPNFFKKVVKQEKCLICKKTAKKPGYYLDDNGNKVAVCFNCVSYAERRALRKI